MDATYDCLRQPKAQEFMYALSEAAKLITLPKHLFLLYYYTFKILLLSGEMLRLYRKVINDCNATCKAPADCVQDFCAITTKIRDDLYSLYKHSIDRKFYMPMAGLIKRSLIDWDDLVEDCTVAADEDNVDLFKQIADAA